MGSLASDARKVDTGKAPALHLRTIGTIRADSHKKRPKGSVWGFTGSGDGSASRMEAAASPGRDAAAVAPETLKERGLPRFALVECERALDRLVLACEGRLDSERFLLAVEEGQRVLREVGIRRRVY